MVFLRGHALRPGPLVERGWRLSGEPGAPGLSPRGAPHLLAALFRLRPGHLLDGLPLARQRASPDPERALIAVASQV